MNETFDGNSFLILKDEKTKTLTKPKEIDAKKHANKHKHQEMQHKLENMKNKISRNIAKYPPRTQLPQHLVIK